MKVKWSYEWFLLWNGKNGMKVFGNGVKLKS